MKRLIRLCLLTNALILTACQQEPPISVSQVSFLDDLTQDPQSFTRVSRDQLLASIDEGDLISMGESHETGLERTYIADLYADLAKVIHSGPVQCLVETAGSVDSSGKSTPISLIPLNGDPVMPQFSKICPPSITFDNPVNDYTDKLKKFLPKGRVLTHTGARHTLPFGLIYPLDFANPEWVDLPPNGTINRQVPKSFLVSGQKMRSHAVWAVDDMLLAQLRNETIAALKKKTDPSQIAAAELAKATRILSSSAVQFSPGEVARVFEMNRVERSFPFQKAYVSMLNHSAFNGELLKTLLGSPEMLTFLKEIDPVSLQVGIQGDDGTNGSTSFGDLLISEIGTIYYSGTVDKKKDAKTALLMISPTQPVKILYADPALQSKIAAKTSVLRLAR